jgi:hypothetical protein
VIFFVGVFFSCGFRHSSFLMVPYLCGIGKCDSLKSGFGAVPCDNRFSPLGSLMMRNYMSSWREDWTRWSAVHGLEYHWNCTVVAIAWLAANRASQYWLIAPILIDCSPNMPGVRR